MTSTVSKRVLFMGPFPPPIHGASVITAALADKVEAVVAIRRINLAPSVGSGLRYHFGRIVCHAKAAALVVSERKNASTVYLSLPGGLGLVYVLPLLALARIFQYEIILHHHSYAYITTQNPLARSAFGIAGKKHISIVLSDRMGEDLRRQYSSVHKTRTLSNAWSIKNGEPRTPGSTSGRVIGHLSNLSVEKGIGTVVEMFDHLANLGGGFTLRIAGPFSNPDAQSIVEKALRKHPKMISYDGPLYGDEKAEFFRSIDVFLFPSTYSNEAEPLVLDEALAGGASVVSSRIGCTSEETFAGEHARIVPPDIPSPLLAVTCAQLSQDRPDTFLTGLSSARKHRAESLLQDFLDMLASRQGAQ